MASQKRIISPSLVGYPGESEPELSTPRPVITNAQAFAEASAAASGMAPMGGPSSGNNGPMVATNLVNPLGDYSGSIVLQGSGNDQKIALKQICRGYWKEPTTITIRSTLLFSISKNDNFFDPTGTHQFAWCRAYIRVTWGVGNLTFTRDVAVGESFEVLANYVQVAGWIGFTAVRGSGTPTNVPVDVSCPIAVSIIAGKINDKRSLRQRQSYGGIPTGDCVHQNAQIIGAGAAPAPLILYEITGYQESANAVYLMLFDVSAFADNFWGPSQALAAGDSPMLQEKIPASGTFSLVIDGGLSFQKALCPVFSSTPGVFTPTDPGELGPFSAPNLGGPAWAMNITYEQIQNAQGVGL